MGVRGEVVGPDQLRGAFEIMCGDQVGTRRYGSAAGRGERTNEAGGIL